MNVELQCHAAAIRSYPSSPSWYSHLTPDGCFYADAAPHNTAFVVPLSGAAARSR